MSIVNSIRNSIVPIHPDGYKFIGIFFGVSVVLGWIFGPLFWVGMVLTLWCAYFFRDPVRTTPIEPNWVISPADGRVSAVMKMVPPEELDLGGDEMWRISVFMNVFNCHVNRAPMTGGVRHINYQEGEFLNAELDKASAQNERNSMVITTEHGDIGVVQIAGLVARRILCWSKVDDHLDAGERFGLIRFGSRLDIYVPIKSRPLVAIGQSAIAGETVLAEIGSDIGPVISRRD